jgi:hypothetical protein
MREIDAACIWTDEREDNANKKLYTTIILYRVFLYVVWHTNILNYTCTDRNNILSKRHKTICMAQKRIILLYNIDEGIDTPIPSRSTMDLVGIYADIYSCYFVLFYT